MIRWVSEASVAPEAGVVQKFRRRFAPILPGNPLINFLATPMTSASCACPAGAGPFGSCKHIAALCYALEEFCRLREVRPPDSCTSHLQQWNRPRKRHLTLGGQGSEAMILRSELNGQAQLLAEANN